MGYHLTNDDDARTQRSATKYTRVHRKPHGGPKTDWVLSTKYTDSETGLLYYGYRYYMPGMGRWASRDPMGERGGKNLYVTCRNDLIRNWDAIGLTSSEDVCNDVAGRVNSGQPSGDSRLDTVADYLRKSGCRFSITCGCCKSIDNTGKARYPSWYPRLWSSCSIKICFNNLNEWEVADSIIHELVHCMQGCRGGVESGCSGCLCAELQAYYWQNPDPAISKHDRTLQALSSCAETSCKGVSIAQAESMFSDAEYQKCLTTGRRNGAGSIQGVEMGCSKCAN